MSIYMIDARFQTTAARYMNYCLLDSYRNKARCSSSFEAHVPLLPLLLFQKPWFVLVALLPLPLYSRLGITQFMFLPQIEET